MVLSRPRLGNAYALPSALTLAGLALLVCLGCGGRAEVITSADAGARDAGEPRDAGHAGDADAGPDADDGGSDAGTDAGPACAMGEPDADADGLCDAVDACFGFNGSGDTDGDGICDDRDACRGDNATGDFDLDGVCDDTDVCRGDDATGVAPGGTLCTDTYDALRAPWPTVNVATSDGTIAWPFAVDLDGDGTDELLGQWHNERRWEVFRAPGTTSFFMPPVRVPTLAKPARPWFADLDGDGRTDIVSTTNATAGLVALRQSATGSFLMEQLIARGGHGVGIPVDVSGDGLLDVIAVNSSDDDLTVFRGRGDGTFEEIQAFAVSGIVDEGGAMVDVDRDGDADLVLGTRSTPGVRWFENVAGTFSETPQPLSAGEVRGLSAADIDGDGSLDLYVNDGARTSVLLNARDGSFAPDVGNIPSRTPVFGDLDGDGDADAVYADHDTDAFHWVERVPAGWGATHTPNVLGDHYWGHVTLGDFDGDGTLDVCASDLLAGGLILLLNPAGLPGRACRGDRTRGDLDGDGVCEDLDLCFGEDATGDDDADGVCGDRDVCAGNDALGDVDGDGVCGGAP